MSDAPYEVGFEPAPTGPPFPPVTLFERSLDWLLANADVVDVKVVADGYAMTAGACMAQGPLATLEAREHPRTGDTWTVAADHIAGRKFTAGTRPRIDLDLLDL